MLDLQHPFKYYCYKKVLETPKDTFSDRYFQILALKKSKNFIKVAISNGSVARFSKHLCH